MSLPQYFRIGAGSIIYNEQGEIVLFARSDNQAIWQLQQGGMDEGEAILTTLWRELKEETGLTAEDFTSVTEYPDWLSYTYPETMRPHLRDQNCRGQIHRWYFIKLKAGVTIDLEKATNKEFGAYKWSTFAGLLSFEDMLKREVYEKLASYFETHIRGI